jgi:hypothetical protein
MNLDHKASTTSYHLVKRSALDVRRPAKPSEKRKLPARVQLLMQQRPHSPSDPLRYLSTTVRDLCVSSTSLRARTEVRVPKMER